jgi:hypothetical protein
VLVVPAILAGVVVPCSGLMLWSVRHGCGGDALYMLLCQIEDQWEADGRLSSGVVLRVQLGDGCIAYVLGLFFTVLPLHINCSWFEVESQSVFSFDSWIVCAVAGWAFLLRYVRCGGRHTTIPDTPQ